MSNKVLYVVHCVDTEGPLNESLQATFARLEAIFNIKLDPTDQNLALLQEGKLNLEGMEDSIAKCFSKKLLQYNSSWGMIEDMLDEIMSDSFRNNFQDDFGSGWVYSWHCMDHIGYFDNPRNKDVGYGNIFRFYQDRVNKITSCRDEINWHFHPSSIAKNPMHAATSYVNNYENLLQILCRRVLEDHWFPVVNRPGFHAERPDSHLFLEQWIPFDYANQRCEEESDQPDLSSGRFGDWRRAPKIWHGYHPSHDDYQVKGLCRRLIFRCLNIGTRFRCLTQSDVLDAFIEANKNGSAILAVANHDYRDMRDDINQVRSFLKSSKKDFPDVLIKYSGAEAAAVSIMGWKDVHPFLLGVEIIKNTLVVKVLSGEIFGPQPFLAIKSRGGVYFHDNLDVIEPNKEWSYVMDDQTIKLSEVSKIGVGAAGKYGNKSVATIRL